MFTIVCKLEGGFSQWLVATVIDFDMVVLGGTTDCADVGVYIPQYFVNIIINW